MKPLSDISQLLAQFGAGDAIVLHSGFAEPAIFTQKIAECAASMTGCRVISMMPMGYAPYGEAAPAEQLCLETFFPGKGLRTALNAGRVMALRHPLSAVPDLFDRNDIEANVVFLQVSLPDEEDEVSLGVSVDYMLSVLRQRPLVVAQINPLMPHTCGESRLSIADIDLFVEAERPVQDILPAASDDVDELIARNVAALIDDNAVLQVGIGSLPDRVLAQLGHLKHLGLHTGIVTDGARPLIEAGVIDNSRKRQFAGIGITTMAGGSASFYKFLNRNPAIEFHPCSLTHSKKFLAKVDNFCAINSALQVDLAGRVNAETVGGRCVSLPGGMPDFAAGAVAAPNGKSIIALRSTFGNGRTSNIVIALPTGTLPTIAPPLVDFLVTEQGAACLRGLSGGALAAAIISVAHPDHREMLKSAVVP
jgi:4-hydroxybutyrate CoA-transferase